MTPEAVTAQRAGEGRADSLVGCALGEYRVLRALGAGGMGIVYEGVQPVIGKRVAIKVLQWEFAANPEQAQRLIAEARAVNAIRHRGIVDIFGLGQLPDGRHYLVMELLEGASLEAVLSAEGRLDPVTALIIVEQVLDALAAAHQVGVIHRDLKPANIFLVTPPTGPTFVKLLDFGIAKQGALGGRNTPQTRNDVFVGTPSYLAPEQARAATVGPETDLYALGCVLFEMLAGRPPFVATTAFEIVTLHLTAPVPRLSSLVPDTPPELDELLDRLLAKNGGERPSSAPALARELAVLREHYQTQRTLLSEHPRSSSHGSPLTALMQRFAKQTAVAPCAEAPVQFPTPSEAGMESWASGPTALRPTGDTPDPTLLKATSAPRKGFTVLSVALGVLVVGAVGLVGLGVLRAPLGAHAVALTPNLPPTTVVAGDAHGAQTRHPAAASTSASERPTSRSSAPSSADRSFKSEQFATQRADPSAREKPPGLSGRGAGAREELNTRIDRHLLALKARGRGGQRVDTVAVQLLEALRADLKAARRPQELAEVARDLSQWETQFGR